MSTIVMLFLALLLGTGIWFYCIRSADRLEPEPILTVLRIMLVGGFFSVLIAGFLNEFYDNVTGLGGLDTLPVLPALAMSLFVGFNEEICKALCFRFQVIKLKAMDEPIDAMIYATSVGLGFAFFENITYMLAYGMETLAVRHITAVPLHVGVAAFYGYGMALERFRGDSNHSFIKGVVIAALVHAAYDWVCFVDNGSMGFLSLLISGGLAWGAIRIMTKRMNSLLAISPYQAFRCSRCKTVMPLDAAFCATCGTPLNDPHGVCRDCNTTLPATASFCPSCGCDQRTSLKATAG